MLNVLITGKLIKDPASKTAKNGNEYAVAALAVPTEGEQFVANVVTFDSALVEKVLAMQKGDALSVTGTAQLNIWQPQNGDARPTMSVIAGAVLSVYEATKRRAQTETTPSPYALSEKAISAMRQAGDIARQNDQSVAGLSDDIPWAKS